MNNELFGFLLVFLACLIGQNLSAQEQLSKIAFGSCAKQDKPQPIWDSINARSPQLFLFLGDNIYGDTQDMDLLRKKWEQLGSQQGFTELKKRTKILATWDDHDYGGNDAGAEYPRKKNLSKYF